MNENINNPPSQQQPQPLQVPSSPKKWYRHKGILAVAILVALAGVVIWVYLTLNKLQDLGPVVVKHKAATTSATDLKDWKTYTNEQYGFEFQYPNGFAVDFGPNNDTDKTDSCIARFAAYSESNKEVSLAGCVYTQESFKNAEAVCGPGSGECVPYPQTPKCKNSLNSSCQDYVHNVFSGDWSKEAYFESSISPYRIYINSDCLITCVANPYPIGNMEDALNDKVIQDLVLQGKIDKLNEDKTNLLNTVYSTFKFTK